MNQKIRWAGVGILSFVLIFLFVFFIFYFNNFFIDYSGMLTFLSVVIILVVFLIQNFLNKVESRKFQIDFLRNIRMQSKLIGSAEKFRVGKLNPTTSHISFFKEAIGGSLWKIPAYDISYFSIDSYMDNLNYTIKGIQTHPLKEMLLLANDRIEIINNSRETIWTLHFEKTKLTKKQVEKMTEVRSIILETIEDLSGIILEINEYLKKFGVKN